MSWYWRPIDTEAANPAFRIIARLSRATLLTLCLGVTALAQAAGTQLLPFPDIWHDRVIFTYADDLWAVSSPGRNGHAPHRASNHGPLLDGDAIFVPEFRTADENGEWNIEGHGVDPDIVVEQDPLLVMQGADPQLERCTEEILKQLPKVPGGLPPRPAAPIKTEVH